MLVPKVNAHFSIKDAYQAFKALTRKNNFQNETNGFYLNHARAGLRIALSALDLPKESKIGISTFNCYTVMNAIKQAGYTVVFLDTTDDLTLDLEDLERKKSELNALIVTHLFGLPNDMMKIKKICPSMPIVEDCAHSFLSSSLAFDTGTIGDFAVFSIGLGKFPSIGDGGILKVNNVKYAMRVNEEIAKLKEFSFFDEIKLIIHLKITSVLHNPFIYKWISLPSKRKQYKNKKINANYKHIESLMAKSVRRLFEQKKVYFQKYKNTQQQNASKVWSELQSNTLVKVPHIDFNFNNCFMLPALHPDREKFAGQVSEFGIEVAPHFAKSIVWAEEFGYTRGSSKNAEKIAEQILIMPVHYNIENKDLAKLIKGIQNKINN